MAFVGHLYSSRVTANKQTNKQINKQDRQALLRAKYCPRIAAALCTRKTHTPKTHTKKTCDFDILYDFEIQQISRRYQGTCSCTRVAATRKNTHKPTRP